MVNIKSFGIYLWINERYEILFECIDYMSAKAPRYIRSQCSYEFKGKFDDYLRQLKLFFSEGERIYEKAHFYIEYDDKKNIPF